MTQLISITLDQSAHTGRSDEFAREQEAALRDLTQEHSFRLIGRSENEKYALHLSILENRICFDITGDEFEERVFLPINSFRGHVKDYFLICESYHEAVKQGQVARIEAIDMGRRGLHNEAADVLRELLEEKITMDHETARKFFTLICALHMK